MSAAPKRVAFFGGSFDPPHLGHIAIARAAREALGLDRIIFAPVGLQPLKPSGSSASFEDRVAMTRLAIAAEPAFEVSLLDAPKSGEAPEDTPNYTIDTLQQLRATLPPDTELYLLLGADSFRSLHHWHRAAEIPYLASLIIASRPAPRNAEPGKDTASSRDTDLFCCLPPSITWSPIPATPNRYRLVNTQGQEASLTILPNLHYDVSATNLRRQLNARSSSAAPRKPQLLDPAVLDYIRSHGLYR